tara:strand:+ start:5577 stop:5903 length:327 start_codon:yes stop_codon:yes gene_type:complete
MKNKVVINGDDGLFALSTSAKVVYDVFAENRGAPTHNWEDDPEGWELDRHDPILIAVVETLGPHAHLHGADSDGFRVVEIPGNRYYILNYDGDETVLTPEGDHWTVIE